MLVVGLEAIPEKRKANEMSLTVSLASQAEIISRLSFNPCVSADLSALLVGEAKFGDKDIPRWNLWRGRKKGASPKWRTKKKIW